MKENKYQGQLIKTLYERFPGCLVVKNDPNYQQGILDLTIFFRDNCGHLEVKASANSRERPNQRYFVEKLNEMSFAAFIYPEIEEEVLLALQQALAPRRRTRVS